MYIVKTRDWVQINEMRLNKEKQSISHMNKYGAG